MNSLLSKVKKGDVITEPFPHIVVKDAIADDLYVKLALELPSIDILSKGKALSSNKRFDYFAKDVFNDDRITSLWKEFIALHSSSAFLQEVIDIFKDQILLMYPNFERECGSLEIVKSGIRREERLSHRGFVDTSENVDIFLDALISVNTPVTDEPTSIKRAHVDLPNKLFAGLFYMRDPQDTSTGGDLEIYKFKKTKPHGFRDCLIPDGYVECVKKVKYEQNVFILFLNSIYSLHGVTVRSLTDYPRYLINLFGEVKKPLFDPTKYQQSPYLKLLGKVKQKAGAMVGVN